LTEFAPESIASERPGGESRRPRGYRESAAFVDDQQDGEPRRGSSRTTRRRPRQFRQRRKVCGFCVDKVAHIDYKDIALLQRYITDHGKIQPRRKTGTCAKHQRALARAVKRARYIALLPYTADHLRLYGSG